MSETIQCPYFVRTHELYTLTGECKDAATCVLPPCCYRSGESDIAVEKAARGSVSSDRFLSVYGATIAVQWAAHIREGRGLDNDCIQRFISEARALAEWTEEVAAALAARPDAGKE